MVKRATSLLIVSWAFIAVAVRERNSGSVDATVAVGKQNLTVVVGTHRSDGGVLSRADLAVPPGFGLVMAASAYLSSALGGLEVMKASSAPSAPWNKFAHSSSRHPFVPDKLFAQRVEELVATNHELQKDAEDISSLMVDTLSSVEAPEDKLVILADKLMKLGKKMVQHSHPGLLYEDITSTASMSKTPLQMAGQRFVDNTLKPLFAYESEAVHQMTWKSNMRRLEHLIEEEEDLVKEEAIKETIIEMVEKHEEVIKETFIEMVEKHKDTVIEMVEMLPFKKIIVEMLEMLR